MSPEFGSTAAIFPIDEVTLDYLRLTGRSEENVRLVEEYTKTQGMWHDPGREPEFSEYLELDLSTVDKTKKNVVKLTLNICLFLRFYFGV